MKKTAISAMLCAVLGAASLLHPAWAGEAKVQWNIADKQVNEDSIAKIDQTFAKLAKGLPDGFRLEVNVRLLKPAVEPDNSNQISKSNSVDPDSIDAKTSASRDRTPSWPRLNFDYVLRDGQGAVVKTGQEELKDMDYLKQARARYGEYEANMVKDWFRKQQQSNAFPVASN